MKITKVYTKGGDKGKTSLVGGTRVKKNSARVEAYGTVDELNSLLGLLHVHMGENKNSVTVQRIQNNLFTIGSNLAWEKNPNEIPEALKLKDGETEFIEQQIDVLNENTPPQTSFTLPGGCIAAATCHVCRTVCRRAERRICSLADEAEIGAELLAYINRVSDYLYILARNLNFISNTEEKVWTK